MTDSFQLFFFFFNLVLVICYLKYFSKKNKRLVLILSLAIGINAAFATGVKVTGILALIFFLGIFLIAFLLNNKHKYFSKKLIFTSLSIVILSFFSLFVFLNPQIHSQPIKGFLKMFTTRWQSAIDYQKTVGQAVNTKTDALKLIFERLLMTNNRFSSFGFIPFIPIDAIFLFGGIFLLFKKTLVRFKKINQLSLESILISWFGLCFFSLIFYLKNDWPRYYLPLVASITLIQAYFLAWLTEKGLTFFRRKVFIKFKDRLKVFNTIFKS